MASGTIQKHDEIIAYDAQTGISYAKFPNGLLVQWGSVTGIAFSSESMKEGVITLPVAFYGSSGYVKCLASPVSSGVANYVFRVGINPGSDLDKLSWTLVSGDGSAITITNRAFSWIAIGRWK